MKPTQAQYNAIYTKDKTLLVSAGAGSGKTTVLTRRLIERIKNGDRVTDFLVVTFMKAAAADVKAKLYDALLAESAIYPDNLHLYNQLNLVSEANICTISSYCLGLVKENFALLGISPRVRVLDETEAALMLRRVTEELIKKGYEEEDPSFLLLADNFSGEKSDDRLVDKMMSLYTTLEVTLGKEEMLISCAEGLRADAKATRENGFFCSDMGRELKERLIPLYNELSKSADELYNYAAPFAKDNYADKLAQLAENCRNCCKGIESNYVNFSEAAINSCETIRLDYRGCPPDIHEFVKVRKADIADTLKDYCKRYCRGDEALIADSLDKCADIVLAINRFLKEMEKGYELQKLEINAMDYTDFELKALQLLETTDENGNPVPTELCLKKQASFKEILIDEYQDVNPLQDKLFTLLSGKSQRFMVGDVKQSIYRFRNAYPDIFLGYKKSFSDDINDKSAPAACIFLRENFRCSPTVINYVNYLFQTVTENTVYRDEYEGEWLVFPESREEDYRKKKKFPVVIALAEKEKDKAKEARRSEAEYIAAEIYDLVHNQASADSSPIQYSDVAVMLSAMKGYSIEYEKAFRKYGIPYKTAVSQSFLENPIISLAVSALKTIDDPTDDISLCALLRSPICGFTSNDLYRIRRALQGVSFYNALCEYSISRSKKGVTAKYRFTKRQGDSAHLILRSRRFIQRLKSWREESTGVSCSDFLKSFFVTSGLFRMSADGGRNSLLLLYEYSTRYENAQNYGISGFLDYLSELSSTGKDISDVAVSGENDAVSFITVHKSKGLEFKVCFLACTEKQFRGLKDNSNITFRRGEGIYFRLRDNLRHTTYNPICNVIAFHKETDLIRAEELRKLYVALTRAKERLYITGCIAAEKLSETYNSKTARSWLELILYTANLGEKDFFTLQTIRPASEEGKYIPQSEKPKIIPTQAMEEIISFKYPYEASVATAAKISVSELREGLLEDDEYNRTYLSVPSSRVSLKPNFAGGEYSSAADIGTANHLFMQFCDFASAERDIRKEAKRLLDIKMFTADQYGMLDFNGLSQFFKSDLYARIKASKRVYREKRFSVHHLLSGNTEPILVQGVIDCFFQNPDGSYTVVDYKTDRVKTPQELIQRHNIQLSCYRDAVESMTGERVSQLLLYSFALSRSIEI